MKEKEESRTGCLGGVANSEPQATSLLVILIASQPLVFLVRYFNTNTANHI